MKRLSNLKAHEVSLVKRGANKKPFLVLKNENGEPMEAEKPSKSFELTEEQQQQEEQLMAKIVGRVTKAEGLEGMSDRAQAAMRAVYRILLPFKDEITDADIDELADTVGVGQDAEDGGYEDDSEEVADAEEVAQSAADDPQPEESMANKSDEKEKPAFMKADDCSDADHAKAMKAAKDAYKQAVGATKKADGEEEEEKDTKDKGADVAKSADFSSSAEWQALPADVRKHFEAVAKSADAEKQQWIRKSAELEGRLAKMEDEREMAGYRKTISEDFGDLSLNVDATCKVMKSLNRLGDDHLSDYLANLKELNERARVDKSFESVGGLYGSGNQAPSSHPHRQVRKSAPNGVGSANEQIESMVKEHMNKVTKSDGRPVEYADAYAAVLATPRGIELYEQSVNEGRGR